MARSLKKGPFVDPKLLKKIKNSSPDSKGVIKTWCRSCTITPEMIGFTIAVHNGKDFIPVNITEEIVGHRLGEFAPSTKFARHGGRIQKELEQKVKEKESEKLKSS